MEVVACKSCGRLFNYLSGQRICPACQKKIEEKFMEVKKYVREHPDIDIKTLSKEMEVSVNQINRWVREERLVFSKDSPVGLPCEGCGKTIKTGRFCDACKANLSNGLRSAGGLDKKPEAAPTRIKNTENRMRFLDH